MIDCSFRVDANADATLAACGKRKKRTVIDDEINDVKEEVQITRAKRYIISFSGTFTSQNFLIYIEP